MVMISRPRRDPRALHRARARAAARPHARAAADPGPALGAAAGGREHLARRAADAAAVPRRADAGLRVDVREVAEREIDALAARASRSRSTRGCRR